MRILHIDSGREMRGGQWQVLHLIAGLSRARHDSILLARSGSPLFERAKAAGADVRPIGIYWLMKLRHGFDLAHAHDARSHTLAAGTGVQPLVVSRRVAFAIGHSALSRWKYSRARHYIAVSKYVQTTLLRAGVPEEKVSVVYDGVPLGEPSPRGSRVVALASDDPMKGMDLLKKTGAAIHYSVNLAEDLRDAAAFVYITREEGLGSAVLMAMAAGVPVIASRVGGLPELVQDGETGLLTDNTPAAISDRISRLLNDPALAAAMAKRARQRVEEYFSADDMVRNTVKVYEKC